jgi:hypothetical protein
VNRQALFIGQLFPSASFFHWPTCSSASFVHRPALFIGQLCSSASFVHRPAFVSSVHFGPQMVLSWHRKIHRFTERAAGADWCRVRMSAGGGVLRYMMNPQAGKTLRKAAVQSDLLSLKVSLTMHIMPGMYNKNIFTMIFSGNIVCS